jgi:hypothetical protein
VRRVGVVGARVCLTHAVQDSVIILKKKKFYFQPYSPVFFI